jgi:hypothetical protein
MSRRNSLKYNTKPFPIQLSIRKYPRYFALFLAFVALFFAFRRVKLSVIFAFSQQGRHASQGDSSRQFE